MGVDDTRVRFSALGGLLGVLLGVLLVQAGSVGIAAGAETCQRSVDADAEGAGAEAALVAALADAQTPVADGDCATWRVDLTGTFRLTAALEWLDPVPLTLAGPADGTARIETDDDDGAVDHRLLTVDTFPDTVAVTLERLVLAGGDVSRVFDDGLGSVEGGAVLADDVVLVDVELVGNAAVAGGAVATSALTAIRTSFLENEAELVDGLGGAVYASGDVTLVNVTFSGNVADQGGALWVDLSGGGGDLTATFTTFTGNAAAEVTSGADLHVEVFGDATQVTLRGVLLAGPGGTSAAPACGGPVDLTAEGAPLVWTDSVATDTSCGAPAAIDAPTFGQVTFRTGMTDLPLPAEGTGGLDVVTCGDGWPDTDQRGLARPQGDACDAGAVERAVADDPEPEPDPEPDPAPAPDPPVMPAPAPVPTEVPAGGGACADGCPPEALLSSP